MEKTYRTNEDLTDLYGDVVPAGSRLTDFMKYAHNSYECRDENGKHYSFTGAVFEKLTEEGNAET